MTCPVDANAPVANFDRHVRVSPEKNRQKSNCVVGARGGRHIEKKIKRQNITRRLQLLSGTHAESPRVFYTVAAAARHAGFNRPGIDLSRRSGAFRRAKRSRGTPSSDGEFVMALAPLPALRTNSAMSSAIVSIRKVHGGSSCPRLPIRGVKARIPTLDAEGDHRA